MLKGAGIGGRRERTQALAVLSSGPVVLLICILHFDQDLKGPNKRTGSHSHFPMRSQGTSLPILLKSQKVWEVIFILFLCVCALSHFSPVRLFATLWTVAHQAPLSMGFSSQEYWSGLPCPPPGDPPNSGIELASLALGGRFFSTSTTWEAQLSLEGTCKLL